jgi:hypothetical protein
MELVPLRNATLVLGKNAQEIIHCSAIEESRQIEENRKEGKYQCDHGYWHGAGTTCMHNVEMIELDDKTIRLEERKPGQLPAPVKDETREPLYYATGVTPSVISVQQSRRSNRLPKSGHS